MSNTNSMSLFLTVVSFSHFSTEEDETPTFEKRRTFFTVMADSLDNAREKASAHILATRDRAEILEIQVAPHTASLVQMESIKLASDSE